MAGLQEIVKLNGYSLYEKRHDGVYKKDLYGKLRRIVAVSPEELKEETYDAYTDIEIGLELLDKPTVEEGLREVLELLGKIE